MALRRGSPARDRRYPTRQVSGIPTIKMQDQLSILNTVLGLLKHLKDNLKTSEEKDRQAEYIIQFVEECIGKSENKSC